MSSQHPLPPNKAHTRIHQLEEALRSVALEKGHLKSAIATLLELKDILVASSAPSVLETAKCTQMNRCLKTLDQLFAEQPDCFEFVSQENENNGDQCDDLKYSDDSDFESQSVSSNTTAPATIPPKINDFKFIDEDLREEAEMIANDQGSSSMDVNVDSPANDGSTASKSPTDEASKSDNELLNYCICNRKAYGRMIFCENAECPHGQWWHFECAGIERIPGGRWFCRDCEHNQEPLDNNDVEMSSDYDEDLPAENRNSAPTKRTAHTCSVCYKQFSRRNHLDRHLGVHTGVKPFRCGWAKCTYSTNIRSNALRHIRTTHFRLPQTQAEQRSRKIIDTRDPNKFIITV